MASMVQVYVAQNINITLLDIVHEVTINSHPHPISIIKSRLAIRVLNYCRPCVNTKYLNDVGC